MTWTYEGGPGATDLNWVRWKVQDTRETDQLVQDEEIEAELADAGTKQIAALAVARVIARRLALLASSKSIGKKALGYQERAEQYAKLVNELEQEVGAGAAAARPSTTEHQFAW